MLNCLFLVDGWEALTSQADAQTVRPYFTIFFPLAM